MINGLPFLVGSMDLNNVYIVLFFSLTLGQQLHHVHSSDLSSEEEKVELRRALDEVTQLRIEGSYGNHLYHSYIFKSGVGNREELRIESVERDAQFGAGLEVVSWQSIQCEGQVLLLGRGLTSISLLVTPVQLLTNRSAHFSEHTFDLGSRVTSTTLLTRWNVLSGQEEVICAVALDSVAADIFWFRVVANKLVTITRWSRYKRSASMATFKDGKRDLLVVADASSSATVDVFDIIFTTDGANLDLRLAQSFSLEGECSSITVCQVARQTYLMFSQPSQQSVAVYQRLSGANSSFIKHYTTLAFPRLSQVVTFSLASQVYIALNGDRAFVFRISDSGDFVEELSLGSVSRWLAVPVLSYRSDVVLFSQNASHTNAFVWGGTNKGFVPAVMPKCEQCLAGDWSGAVTVPLRHRNCLLLPRLGNTSSLVHIATSLHSIKNPIKDQIDSMTQSMKQYEEHIQNIESKLMEAEESLKHIIKVDEENVITARWKLGRVQTNKLTLSSMVKPSSEVRETSEPVNASPAAVDVAALSDLVEQTVTQASQLYKDVLLKEKQVWGLDTFSGKLIIQGRLIVENLTVTKINEHVMDDVLQNTYRKDKPQPIQGNTIIHSLQVENLYFDKINKNLSKESMKFSDEPVEIKGDVHFHGPLSVEGQLRLEAGARVNGLNLSEELCGGEDHCAVFPNVGVKPLKKDFNKNQYNWTRAIGGKNLTVKKINGVSWDTIVGNIVYLDKYQQIPGTTIVNGALSSDVPLQIGTVNEHYRPQQRDAGNVSKSGSPVKKSPGSTGGKLQAEPWHIDPFSNVVFTDLEVTGTVTCGESEWGLSASDVVLSDREAETNTNPVHVHVYGDKVFDSEVDVANNLEVKGLVGGVNVADLLTTNTPQVFTDFTTLHGNVTLGSITLSGSWNGVNISDGTINGRRFSIGPEFMRNITANRVRVTDTLNGIPVSQLVFTDDNGVTTVGDLFAHNLTVGQMNVDGKVANQDLKDFENRRLSISEEQTVTGNFIIHSATVSNEFEVERLNNINMSNLSSDFGVFSNIDEVHLSALHVDGNITTDLGLNGYNLAQLAERAVWLNSNNMVTGHLIFQEDLTVEWLDCQAFFNQDPCHQVFDFSDVVYKTNETITFSGKKKFLNSLSIVENVNVETLNGHKVETILTKTTDQEIKGDVVVHGNVAVAGEFTLEGLLNNQNLTETVSRCTLSGDTITCSGDAEFEDIVLVEHLNCKRRINQINFTHFTESLVDVKRPQPISGFKNFSGKVTLINLDVHKINNNTWDDFLVNTVKQNSNENVELPVTFMEKVSVFDLSVDYDLEADSVNGVDLKEWRTNAIYLNESFNLNRTLHLSSASSAGNLTIVTYGEVTMEVDLIRLHSPNIIAHLEFESVTVLDDSELGVTVNGKNLSDEERRTLKISGNQTVMSDLMLSDDVVISGNVTISGQVNHYSLLDLVTLNTDQLLNGNYKFECVNAAQNVTSSALVSGVNVSEWKATAVVLGEGEGWQDIAGVWTVLGDVEFRGPVTGEGRLADVDLAELKHNVTRDILNVRRDLKENLTTTCREANDLINKARNQTSEFLSLDLAQEISVPDEVSLVTHFKSQDDNYLTISDKQCTTTVYVWDKLNGSYISLFSVVMGFEVSQLLPLHHNQLTYLVSVSADLSMNCYFSGKHLWLFAQDHIKHISVMDLGEDCSVEVYGNALFSMNATGVYKWTLQFGNDRVNLKVVQTWPENTGGKRLITQEAGIGLALYNHYQITSLESDLALSSGLFQNWTGDLLSISVSPSQRFIAIATSERAQVPRYSDHVKVYNTNGSLFDKIPAKKASHLHWFAVPNQTWLVFEQNHTYINLYQLQGMFEGFQLRLSAKIEGIAALSSLALPMASKVNLQPHIIVQSVSSVKVLQSNIQGDPYPGPDLPCAFDDSFQPMPSR